MAGCAKGESSSICFVLRESSFSLHTTVHTRPTTTSNDRPRLSQYIGIYPRHHHDSTIPFTTKRITSEITAMSTPDDNLHAPRILCLHGGGVNSSVFRSQCRALIKHLPAFRLVFADGPWFCEAGPGIVPVYEDCGPFRRWLR